MQNGQENTDAPLLSWPEQRVIADIERRRRDLINRIARLPRFSHRRIELEARLRALTAEGLGLETTLGTIR